jgi:hypothetical protein
MRTSRRGVISTGNIKSGGLGRGRKGSTDPELILPAAELEVASPPGVAEMLMPAEVEVPLWPGVAKVPILAEVEVPLGPSATAVSMVEAEPGGGEVLFHPIAPASPTPPSSMLCPFFARPFPTYCIHKRRTNST